MNVINKLPACLMIINISVLSGCVPHAAYRAHQDHIEGREVFVMNDNYLRVPSESYPIFSVVEDREAPRSIVSNGWEGLFMPAMNSYYRWEVSHAFNGRFLLYSEEYDGVHCIERLGRNTRHSRKENCEIGAKGAPNKIYVYARPSGEAYGWQYLRNQDWYVLQSDKISRFRIDDSGDWSGQPWFECVARCDKLERMKREEVEGGDPFGVGEDKEWGGEAE
ncbi:hypothetical protein HOP51_17210 [Halomonas sp. MCCC 1A11036]|uniref:Lipoprotein n=1 Tax=Billgrantia zhangzhouensis TaxID=2733481 RepID=A0ABS9AJC9_9GAMM|nr:hypothetical protein [Halomonas zhangzhouensis]MCE8021839.1 hypothetical protein [Halomonas zhangzhouensis]